MSAITLAWLMASIGAFLSCLLLTVESLGKKMPEWSPLREHMWGRFVLICVAGVIWIIFSNI